MGAFVGKLKKAGDHGEMVDYVYRNSKNYLPSDAEVKAMRPAQ